MDAEVIVVGGGPAGASTAWSLAQSGHDVLVLDRARFPRDKVCAEYLSPQASRILSAMGALEEIESSGAAHLAGMEVRAPNGRTIRGEFAAVHGFRPFRDRGLAIRRTLLDDILIRRAVAAGARLQEGVKVSDLMRDSNGTVTGVIVRDEAGIARTLRARLVVGADGLRSIVGRRLGLVKASRWPKRIALVAHYRNVGGISDVGEMHCDRDGYFGLVDVGGGLTNVAVVVPIGRAGQVVEGKAAFLEEWIASRPHLADRFTNAERISAVRATGPFASAAKRAWAPGAVLVGDAADFYDPFTGEGIFTALRGGEILAPFIAASLRPDTDANCELAAYDAARLSEFRGKWKVERLVGMAVAYPAMMNRMAAVLSRRKDMADLLVGVAGDYVPPEAVLSPKFLFTLFFSPVRA